jgi:hypothetical protein
MSNQVYANGREVSCKAGEGKSICAFPDVCLSPPTPPAGPIPIPYPNTGVTTDTSNGSKTVQISGQEVMLKNSSAFKTSTGDEAATKSQGMNVITHQIQGKCYFTSWSMDVKIEGENAVRHLDLMTHNHASEVGATPPWNFQDRAAIAESVDECKDAVQDVKDNCNIDDDGNVKCPCPNHTETIKTAKDLPAFKDDKDPRQIHRCNEIRAAFKGYKDCMKRNKCEQAAKCLLSEKSPDKCCQPQTPHHIVPASQFKGVAEYEYNKAACICVEGNNQTQGSHGDIHAETAARTKERFPEKFETGNYEVWKCGDAERLGAEAVEEVFGCDADCIEAQLRKKHRAMGINKDRKVEVTAPGPKDKKLENDTTT